MWFALGVAAGVAAVFVLAGFGLLVQMVRDDRRQDREMTRAMALGSATPDAAFGVSVSELTWEPDPIDVQRGNPRMMGN